MSGHTKPAKESSEDNTFIEIYFVKDIINQASYSFFSSFFSSTYFTSVGISTFTFLFPNWVTFSYVATKSGTSPECDSFESLEILLFITFYGKSKYPF